MTSLVLIPGLAADATMWQAQLAAFARWSPAVADVHMRHDTIEAMAHALLSGHDDPLVLCGASMGGMIAMEAARQAPDRIRGLALLGTNARPESDAMRALREAAIELFAQGRIAEVIEPNVAFAFHPDNAGTLAPAYLEFVLRAGGVQLIRQNRAVISRPDARLHLPHIRCPTLVLCGEADQLTPPECSREIAGLVPGARLVMVPRCGHMLTMERPDVVNAELTGWLSQRMDARSGPA
jgi:pimeloyl-ACP methyl ester carboxylesterase